MLDAQRPGHSVLVREVEAIGRAHPMAAGETRPPRVLEALHQGTTPGAGDRESSVEVLDGPADRRLAMGLAQTEQDGDVEGPDSAERVHATLG